MGRVLQRKRTTSSFCGYCTACRTMGPRPPDEQTFSLFIAFAPRHWRKQIHEYRALPAYLHLTFPAFLRLATTDGSVDEPAEMSCLKFPCRALQPGPLGTSLHGPAWSGALGLKGFKAMRNSAWRSAGEGISRHPCSKLCTALSEVPRSRAICFCVFPKSRRI